LSDKQVTSDLQRSRGILDFHNPFAIRHVFQVSRSLRHSCDAI